jgi:hypothetical protein
MIITLPKIGPVRFDDNISSEELNKQVGLLAQKYDFKIPKREVGIGTLLKEGFMRGMGETGIAFGDTLPAMGASALGFDEYAKQQMGEADASRQALEAKYPTQFKSYTEVESPYEGAQFIAETLGELGPTALTAMVPGVGAGVTGSRLAASGVMKAAQSVGPLSMAGRAAAEIAAKEAAQIAGKRAMYGGVYLGSFAQNAPEVFESIYKETGKMEPGIAALASGLSSVLDTIVPGKLMSDLGGYGRLKVIEKMAKDSGAAPKVWKYIGAEAAKTAGSEGLTEAAQETINAAAEQVAGSTKDMFGPENIQRFKESFVKGAIGGGAFGTVSGTSQGLTARKDYRGTQEAEAALKAQYEAEKAAGSLTPEKQAEYDIAFENARKQRESELTSTFEGLPDYNQREENLKALQARMDQMRPSSPAYADLQEQITKAQEEAENARKAQEEIDAARAAGSTFADAAETKSGLFTSKTRITQPVTEETLALLNIPARTNLGQSLLGLDLSTVRGAKQFVNIMEDPATVGSVNIDEDAYLGLRSEVDSVLTKAKPKGAPDATRPDTTTGGGSPSVVSEPVSTEVAGTDEASVGSRDVSTKQDAGDTAVRERKQPTTLTEEDLTDGTTTTETQQAEPQKQEAPATKAITPARGTSARPDLSGELPNIVAKLGDKAKVTGLTELAKDARAYFSKVVPELALDSIANDLVYQPTAYRNSKMTLPSATKKGTFAATPEPMFGTEAEAAFFKGQGGVHAANAEKWARANLSPEAVTFLDQKIAQYKKEKQNSDTVRRRQESQTKVRKATKEQVADESAAAKAEGEYAPTLEEIESAKGTKTLAGKRKKDLQRLARELESDQGDLDDIADTDITGLLADADLAALHTQAHPAVLNQLENNNLSGALQALADSGSSKTAELFAQQLSKLVGDVNLVYGADVSRYDPETNTIYLRDGATEYEILHESSHATMSHTLDNPSHPITRQVTNLFNQMKKGTEGTYGAQDIQEFAAEAWSNDAFRNRLKEFKPTGEKFTGWERLVNAVRQLLRLPSKQETALDAIDRMLNDIISPPPAKRTGETLYAQSLHNPNVVQEMFTKINSTIRSKPVMNSERAVGFWKAAEKIGTTGRQLMYKALNLSALGEVGSKYLGNTATRFANTIEEMAGYQEKLLEAMYPLHSRLAEFRQTPEYQAWSTLVNDSTRVDVNPEADFSKYKGSPTKEAEWKQLHARFIKLTSTGQKLYRDLFATYKELDKEFLKSLERNIGATVGDKSQAATAYQKILQELAAIRVDHYAPLFREGPFWLQYDINGETKKEAFESEAELNYARQQLEAKGVTNVDFYLRADQLTSKNVPSGTMLAEIIKIMQDNGAGKDAVDDLVQLVVKAMPEASILKSRQKRTGIGGYIDNAAYVFDRVSSNTARQLGRMQYGPELQRLVAEMQETVDSARGDTNRYGGELINEFEGRREFAMKPTLTAFSQYASSGAFYYNLAGNVSSAVINTLQTPLVVFPQLGGEYGFKDSYLALNNARKLYMSSGFTRKVTELTGEVTEVQNEFQILNRMGLKAMTSIENLVNSGKAPQYAGLIGAMKDRGLLATSTARSALNSENNNSSGYGSTNKLARYTTLIGSFMFHHAERMNREITAVAAYDLEMAKLKNSKMSDAEKQTKAIDKALKLVEYSHGAGSTLSGPSLGQSDIGKVLMVFKRFAFSMYYMLFDTMMRSLPVKGATGEQLEAIKAARRQLAGVYGMSALFAGAKGLPLYWVAELAYNMFQDKDDDDFDTVMREYLGDFFYKGPVNYVTNLSIADRVGWTDLLWREQKGSKADASALSQFMESLLGAPYSIVDSTIRGVNLVAEGQMERGIEAMLPVSMRNILKGGRYAVEGANTLRGDAVGDVNGANAFMQVLGFAPADLMKQYEENAYMTEKGKAIKSIEKNALKKYYAAMREGDADGMMEAREKLFELGAKYPDLKISESTITKSVKARERISAEMYNGVSLDRKLAPYLKQAAAEAYGE